MSSVWDTTVSFIQHSPTPKYEQYRTVVGVGIGEEGKGQCAALKYTQMNGVGCDHDFSCEKLPFLIRSHFTRSNINHMDITYKRSMDDLQNRGAGNGRL